MYDVQSEQEGRRNSCGPGGGSTGKEWVLEDGAGVFHGWVSSAAKRNIKSNCPEE